MGLIDIVTPHNVSGYKKTLWEITYMIPLKFQQ